MKKGTMKLKLSLLLTLLSIPILAQSPLPPSGTNGTNVMTQSPETNSPSISSPVPVALQMAYANGTILGGPVHWEVKESEWRDTGLQVSAEANGGQPGVIASRTYNSNLVMVVLFEDKPHSMILKSIPFRNEQGIYTTEVVKHYRPVQ